MKVVTDLTKNDISRWAFYKPQVGELERGKIKSFDNKAQVAWVVYKCNEDWDNYENYTAASTNYSDLRLE